MDRFPMRFSYEGGFYKAWMITKKMYLGQKIPA